MKSLLLVRHAKSSWDEQALSDKDRPLAQRGKRDAPRTGKRLRERGVQPQLIVSSPARRALATAQSLARQLGYAKERIEMDERLYPGDADRVLQVIRALQEHLTCVMLVGHNPGLSELAHRFSREITDLPTCAVAEFEFDTASWSDIGRRSLAAAVLDYPKKA